MTGKTYWTLTPFDLTMHPIWVPGMDVAMLSEGDDDPMDDDPGRVVPLPEETALADRLLRDSDLYVRTTFITASGRHFIGLMKSTGEAGVRSTAPAIATDDGQVGFYHGIARPPADALARDYRRLGLSAEDLFPLTYRPDVSIHDGSPGGVLHGFYYLETADEADELRHVV